MQSHKVVGICVVSGQGFQREESKVWSQVLCRFIWDESHHFILDSSFFKQYRQGLAKPPFRTNILSPKSLKTFDRC